MTATANRPEWLKRKAPSQTSLLEMGRLLSGFSLHTVCQEADCPNIGECFEKRTATFMIMGRVCTRNCRFCAVSNGTPCKLDRDEPLHVAQAVNELELKHVVITSVTRDDIEDGGAEHFAKTVEAIRNLNPGTTVELLIPDLKGLWAGLETIAQSKPDIINHNVETVPSLYSAVRPGAVYNRSVELLKRAKEIDSSITTKSGMMLGLGENKEQVERVMEDLRDVECDILTLGQYLQPTREHYPIYEYISPGVFEQYRNIAYRKGFKYVAAGAFVRSSYKAAEGMKKIRDGE